MCIFFATAVGMYLKLKVENGLIEGISKACDNTLVFFEEIVIVSYNFAHYMIDYV